MREIKFRAWEEDAGFEDGVDMRLWTWKEMCEMDMQHMFNNPKYELMQYTGLKDKNGTEIYEGDIVRLQSVDGVDYNAQIVFKDGGFCAIDGAIDNFAVSRYNLTIFDLEITVIGNIYEHYELLERDEE